MSEGKIPTYEEWMVQQEIKIAGLKQMLDAELLASYPYTWRKAQDVPEITKSVGLGEWVDIDRRREMSEHEYELVSHEFKITREFAERLQNLQVESLAELKELREMDGFAKALIKAEGAVREDRVESEIREGEYEWVEVLVPSHLYIPIQQIIETFLESHGVNDGNGGWNKLKWREER